MNPWTSQSVFDFKKLINEMEGTMPYRLSSRMSLADENGVPLQPDAPILTSDILNWYEWRAVGDQKFARVRRDKPSVSPEGWVPASLMIPLYGQTARKNGLVLEGNEEVRDKCRQLANRIDKRFEKGLFNGPSHFMLGVLLCETLDGDKVFYAAYAGNWAVADFDKDATASGCIGAQSVQGGSEHFRDMAGKVFKARPKSGPRVGRPAGLQAADLTQLGNWDDLDDPIDRVGNALGSCAAQKMLQLAIKHNATPRHMWEQWYDTKHMATQDRLPIESCSTCAVNIPRMLDRGAKKTGGKHG
ncbi:hypothetical protein JOD97_000792 [Duganella sp. 1411]|uniref:hypothetical protein n=1 Tax=Duganella sp. 1411 TaxID=2806572 RepID=UPI001AE7EF9F|nr:hypothetical protein [Duganella sp. 1411]MBP1202778.1 hypothetical protein [Duganella sp. 1411]